MFEYVHKIHVTHLVHAYMNNMNICHVYIPLLVLWRAMIGEPSQQVSNNCDKIRYVPGDAMPAASLAGPSPLPTRERDCMQYRKER